MVVKVLERSGMHFSEQVTMLLVVIFSLQILLVRITKEMFVI